MYVYYKTKYALQKSDFYIASDIKLFPFYMCGVHCNTRRRFEYNKLPSVRTIWGDTKTSPLNLTLRPKAAGYWLFT